MSNATLRQTATYTCTKNVCLSIHAAAALHGEEAGEAEDEEVQRADHYGGGEEQIGTGALGKMLFAFFLCVSKVGYTPGEYVHGERANFAVLVLLCIDASDCESRRIF